MKQSGHGGRALLLMGVAWATLSCGGGGASDTTLPSATGDGARATRLAALPAHHATWSPPVALPLVPAAAANLPDGKLLLWSAQDRFSFTSAPGNTYTTVFDPATGTSVERLVTETDHNMFCPGTANLPDGRLLISGGSSSAATSFYDPASGTWTPAGDMVIPRAYHATVPLGDGSVFALGGSWNGGLGNKDGELWTAATGWRRLPGVPVDPMLGPDPAGVYRGDNHMWLVPTAHGRVLHAGPSANMNWIDVTGSGSTTPAGARGDDPYAINGSIVMFEAGRLLKTGGARAYENADATASAHVIDTTGVAVGVRRLPSMAYARAFHNSVVLPNGQVVVLGGQTYPVPFSDSRSVLAPELWDPATERFTTLPAMSVPRNYHSTALLLPDGRVASIGGGLCGEGCEANHADLQILSPPYLFDESGAPATRPVIVSAPDTVAYGTEAVVKTSAPVASFAIVRLSSTTHTVNNDQRRLSLSFTAAGSNRYRVQMPRHRGLALPGYWMLFALDASGVPSVAHTLRVDGDSSPVIQPLGEPTSLAGTALRLQVTATGTGPLAYAASGLPPGLAIEPTTGLITGTPRAPGRYLATLTVSQAGSSVSLDVVWTVLSAAFGEVRHVKFEALSEVQGRAWTSMAEFNLLDANGRVLPRAGWTVSADSQETEGENAPATQAIDGSSATFWHTQWLAASPPPPHQWVANLGGAQVVRGFRYLPRQGSSNGRVADWRLHVSSDGVNWRVVASGRFKDTGAAQTVFPIDAIGNQPPTLVAPPAQAHRVGRPGLLTLAGSDPEGDPLTYSASGLPPGMALNPSTGVISGTFTAAGTYEVTASVSDGQGGQASTRFPWVVLEAELTIEPVAVAPAATGSSVSFTARSSGGAGVLYQWDYGDGSRSADSTDATTYHVYAAAGLYTVTLSVTDVDGLVATYSFTQAIHNPATARSPRQSSSLAWEARSTGAARIWVVNADRDTVSAFDAATRTKLAEVPVGAAPRRLALAPDGRLWVSNRDDASISIVHTGRLSVVRTLPLPRASRPHGVVFAPDGSAAYVVLAATGEVLKLNPSTGARLASAPVGPEARDLAVTADGTGLLVSRFITPFQPGEATASVLGELGGQATGGEVVMLKTASLSPVATVVLQHSRRPDSTVQGRGVPNYLGAAVISPDGRSAWVPSKQDNLQRGMLRDGAALDFQNTVRAVSSRIDLALRKEDGEARIDHDNSGRASAAAFHPTGAFLFIALQTSRQIAVVDPVRRREVARVDVGRAPDALAVSPDGLTLWVSNFMDRTLQALDLSPLVTRGQWSFPTVAVLATQSGESLAAPVLRGKQLFYDAWDTRLARDRYLSCATCHDDGGHDGRTWDLTGFGEGLRNTISLRGRAGMGQGRLHWSGNFDEVQDFEGQIRDLAGGAGLMSDEAFFSGTVSQPLGTPKAGRSDDLDALASYVASLDTMPASPGRSGSGELTSAAAAGRRVFAAQQCASCHGGASFAAGGLLLADVGTLQPSSGRRLGTLLPGIDVPTLRDVHASAPYLHNGSAGSLAAAVQAHRGVSLGAGDLDHLAAYLGQIGREEAAAPADLPASTVACATEGGTCQLPAGRPATVYFGAGSQWTSLGALSGAVACSASRFGDPAAGQAKACRYLPARRCASEGGQCQLPAGQVATLLYGAAGAFHARIVSGGGHSCSSDSFGDPAPGVAKACWTQ